MARYTGPVCKLCRREAKKLYLKGDRCFTEKCAMERRPFPPGQHGQTRIKNTDYGIRLREKQKLKRIYGLLEAQFRHCFAMASRQKGETGENLLQLLERRLDNIVFRMGFVATRREARQLVRHCHFLVNGKKVNLPSYLVRIGDEVRIRDKSKQIQRIQEALDAMERRGVPDWLELDRQEMAGKVVAYPTRDHQIIQAMEIRDNLIVELYSK